MDGIFPGGFEGTTAKVIKASREIRPTRLLIPNDYLEHMDHEALCYIGLYDRLQTGEPVIAYMGDLFRIKSYLKYGVWADFFPEGAFSTGRNPSLRGNIAIKVKEENEAKILQALGEFKSQEKITACLTKRHVTKNRM